MDKRLNIIFTSCLVGIVAYMCADLIHEVIGHGGVALITGNHIDLLTSVYFKSSPGEILVDLGGPLSNLFFGILICVLLNYNPKRSLISSLLLITIMSYNLFWFSGTLLQSGFGKVGDWTYTVAKLEVVFAKPLLIVSGLIAYFLSIKLIAKQYSNLSISLPEIFLKQSIYYAYFTAALAAAVAGLFYAPDRISASKEGLLEMLASLPVLFISTKETKQANPSLAKTSWIFYFSVCLAFIIFCFSLGQGFY